MIGFHWDLGGNKWRATCNGTFLTPRRSNLVFYTFFMRSSGDHTRPQPEVFQPSRIGEVEPDVVELGVTLYVQMNQPLH